MERKKKKRMWIWKRGECIKSKRSKTDYAIEREEKL